MKLNETEHCTHLKRVSPWTESMSQPDLQPFYRHDEISLTHRKEMHGLQTIY